MARSKKKLIHRKKPAGSQAAAAKQARAKLHGAHRILLNSLGHLRQYWRIFSGLTLVHIFLTLLVVGFGGGSGLTELKTGIQESLGGVSLGAGIELFGFLIRSASTVQSEAVPVYQSILFVLISLAIIWTLRQTHAGKKVGLREAFYKSTHPLVPFVLILLVITLQLLPLVAANFLSVFVLGSGLAVTALEKVLWLLLIGLLISLTLYMIASSVLALYVVTLPDITPMKALRSARELVRGRRWTVIRKLLFLGLVSLLVTVGLILPLIMYATWAAEGVFYALTMAAPVLLHSYMYTLYRELL